MARGYGAPLTTAPADLARELELERALTELDAIGRLSCFVRLMWPLVEPAPLEWGWHMGVICDELQAVAEGRERRLLINVPPGFSKSLLTSVFFPAWKWLRWPADRSLYLSHSDDLARRDSRRTRILLQSPEYARLKARAGQGWTFAKDQNEKDNFENTARGFRHCAPLGAGITGKRGDNLVIDDPHDAKEAIQGDPERIAERLTESCTTFDQVVRSRLNDQRRGALVVIMQRLHDADLSGHLLAQGGWRHVCLPMRYDPERAHPADPRREPGELLDPRRFPPEVVADLERALGSQAPGQLDQRPQAKGGGMLPAAAWLWLDRSAWPRAFRREAIGADLALGQSEGASNSALFWGGLLDGRVYIGDAEVGVWGITGQVEAMRRITRRHPSAASKYIEDRANARALEDILRADIPGLKLVEPDGDKVARVQAWQPYLDAGNLVLPCRCGAEGLHRHPDERTLPGEPWAVDLVRECASFPKGARKDRVDALGYLVRPLLTRRAWEVTTA